MRRHLHEAALERGRRAHSNFCEVARNRSSQTEARVSIRRARIALAPAVTDEIANQQSPFNNESRITDRQSAVSGAIPVQPKRLHPLVQISALDAKDARGAGNVPVCLFERLTNSIALGGVAHFVQA